MFEGYSSGWQYRERGYINVTSRAVSGWDLFRPTSDVNMLKSMLQRPRSKVLDISVQPRDYNTYHTYLLG